jgi:hypothetical protein
MTQRCKTCDHPERSAVDIEIARGVPATAIAKRFNLPNSSISRHKRSGHVPASILYAFPRHRADLSAEALAQLRADESAGVLLHLAQQRSTLLRLQDECEAKKWRPLQLAAAREILKNIEATARCLGVFAEHERSITQVQNLAILAAPEYVGLRADLIAALRPFPAARQAVGAVLTRLEGASVHFDGIRTGIDGVKPAGAAIDGTWQSLEGRRYGLAASGDQVTADG